MSKRTEIIVLVWIISVFSAIIGREYGLWGILLVALATSVTPYAVLRLRRG